MHSASCVVRAAELTQRGRGDEFRRSGKIVDQKVTAAFIALSHTAGDRSPAPQPHDSESSVSLFIVVPPSSPGPEGGGGGEGGGAGEGGGEGGGSRSTAAPPRAASKPDVVKESEDASDPSVLCVELLPPPPLVLDDSENDLNTSLPADNPPLETAARAAAGRDPATVWSPMRKPGSSGQRKLGSAPKGTSPHGPHWPTGRTLLPHFAQPMTSVSTTFAADQLAAQTSQEKRPLRPFPLGCCPACTSMLAISGARRAKPASGRSRVFRCTFRLCCFSCPLFLNTTRGKHL